MLKKTTKRFISIVMAVMMIISMIPFTAFAADETTASDNTETTNAIGGTIEKVADTDTWYSEATKEFMTRTSFWNDKVLTKPESYTVDEASKTVSISNAEALVWWAKQVNSGTSFAGYTINITDDIDLSAHYWTPICTGTVSYTADGKYSIANNTSLNGTIINGNEHTIKGLATQTGLRGPNQDSKPGDGQNCYYDAAFIGYSCCDITIEDLTFDGARIAISDPDAVTQTNGSSMLAVVVGAQTGGSLTLNNVTVNKADVLAMQKAAAFVGNLMGNSKLTVNNCAITNSRFSAYFQVAPISSYSTAEQVTINGIKLENNQVRMVDQSWPAGYYQDPNNDSWYLDRGDYGNSIDINACTTAMFYDGTNTAITNGTLSGTGTAWTPVASVNDYMYASLEAALDAAKDGDTIKLLEDVTVTSPISTKKALTFEGVTKTDGTKPVIRSAGANGLFSQAGDAVYTIKNLTLETSSDGQWYIYHSANTLTIEYCDFIMAEDVSNTGNVVMGEGDPSTDEDYTLIFKNNTITANSRAALTGVGNNSIITQNIIDLVNEKHGNTDSRTSMIALTAVAGKGTITISENTFKNANRAIAVDNSSLSASDLTVKNNQFINVRFAFELSPTKNVNQGTFDLSKNYYNFNDTVSALKVQNADSEGDKFNFGEGSSEYLPEGTNLVITEPYYTAPTMKDEDLNTYVPPSTGGGTVTPTPDPEPEEPSDSEETVTNPDGSTTTTITKEDGSSSTTTVGTDGKVESEVTVSKDAVDNADGSAVTLPMPKVAVTSDKDTAATVTVNLPSKDATKVEVPVKDVTAGTVAVLVDADGNETVIKDTVQSDNGITFEVTDGATIKVVDNSKSFNDVADNYWGADAIDFATSRELFAGTAENTFSPEGDMTRAMIWSVLARYEGADIPGGTGDTWYAGPQKWAMENGISDGTMPNSSMTREQFAAMLYRYVGSPAVSGTVGDYSDADSISSWASDAMVWAVQQGLIAGMDDGTLNPQGTATRTQVAAIFQRFIENKMS